MAHDAHPPGHLLPATPTTHAPASPAQTSLSTPSGPPIPNLSAVVDALAPAPNNIALGAAELQKEAREIPVGDDDPIEESNSQLAELKANMFARRNKQIGKRNSSSATPRVQVSSGSDNDDGDVTGLDHAHGGGEIMVKVTFEP